MMLWWWRHKVSVDNELKNKKKNILRARPGVGLVMVGVRRRRGFRTCSLIIKNH
jgi:hypothetical protein